LSLFTGFSKGRTEVRSYPEQRYLEGIFDIIHCDIFLLRKFKWGEFRGEVKVVE
jgi:hypothetical protein